MPIWANTARTSVTSPKPPSTPSAEPTRPTTAAWVRTEVKTWVGDAPTARSIASSRWR